MDANEFYFEFYDNMPRFKDPFQRAKWAALNSQNLFLSPSIVREVVMNNKIAVLNKDLYFDVFEVNTATIDLSTIPDWAREFIEENRTTLDIFSVYYNSECDECYICCFSETEKPNQLWNITLDMGECQYNKIAINNKKEILYKLDYGAELYPIKEYREFIYENDTQLLLQKIRAEAGRALFNNEGGSYMKKIYDELKDISKKA